MTETEENERLRNNLIQAMVALHHFYRRTRMARYGAATWEIATGMMFADCVINVVAACDVHKEMASVYMIFMGGLDAAKAKLAEDLPGLKWPAGSIHWPEE